MSEIKNANPRGHIPEEEAKEIITKYEHNISNAVAAMKTVIEHSFEGLNFIDFISALPIAFRLEEIDFEALEKNAKKQNIPMNRENIRFGGYISVDTEHEYADLVVNIIIKKDINENWEEVLSKIDIASSLKTGGTKTARENVNKLAFIYMHEALHIMLRHYDFYTQQADLHVVQEKKPEFGESEAHQVLNHAYDYYINAVLLETAAETEGGSDLVQLKDWINKTDDKSHFAGGMLFDRKLNPMRDETMTTQKIILELLKTANMKKRYFTASGKILTEKEATSRDPDEAKNDPLVGEISEITINGNTTTQIGVYGQHNIGESVGNTEETEKDLQTAAARTSSKLSSASRGTGSAKFRGALGIDENINTEWFTKLESSLLEVARRNTSHYEQTWGRIKNKMRHVAKLPGRVFYEKKYGVVLSIDQSGSMSDHDLEQINGVITRLAKKAEFIEIIIHDYKVVDVKKFKKYQLKNNIKEYLTERKSCGGTSHKEVFLYLKEIKETLPKNTKVIYMSFSDNYSDIEMCWDKTLEKKYIPYWIKTGGRAGQWLESVPGMQVDITTGRIK